MHAWSSFAVRLALTRAQQAQFAAFTQLVSRALTTESFEVQLAVDVYPLLCATFVATGRLSPEAVSVEEAALLLAKESANGFCVMAPPDADGARCVRGTGIFLQASRMNHGARWRPATSEP